MRIQKNCMRKFFQKISGFRTFFMKNLNFFAHLNKNLVKLVVILNLIRLKHLVSF